LHKDDPFHVLSRPKEPKAEKRGKGRK